jgi:Reverse transcriptase (RNA-dependent DNA polymerase)
VDGHLTDVPIESVYSGVVSLRGIRLLLFLAELNKLEVWATDVGNAYLEARTKEKLYIIAGPEFGNRVGHILIIQKALYGLRTSGLHWHEHFANCLREMGFVPCRAEPDIWLHRNGGVYEYIAVYVDNLAIAAKDPKDIIEVLENMYINSSSRELAQYHFTWGAISGKMKMAHSAWLLRASAVEMTIF